MKILDDFNWGKRGKNTIFFGKKQYEHTVKTEYTVLEKGKRVRLHDFQVMPFQKKGEGLGTKAYNLFEKSRKENEIVVVAGFKEWPAKKNWLAFNFWSKMGFAAKARPRGRPIRMVKKRK